MKKQTQPVKPAVPAEKKDPGLDSRELQEMHAERAYYQSHRNFSRDRTGGIQH